MKEPNVSVAILKNDILKFELNGSFYCEQIDENFSGYCKITIENDKIIFESNSKIYELNSDCTFTPSSFQSHSFLIIDVLIGIKFHWEQKQNQEFLGSLKIIREKNNLVAINILPVEDYLTSVISSEMSASSSDELLKAHAIISRSWLIAQIEKSKEIKTNDLPKSNFINNDEKIIKWFDREDHKNYDVCADDHCQRYQGITKIISEKSANAINSTRGMLLFYNDEICDARYSKSCGGISERYENVWDDVQYEYLKEIVDWDSTTIENNLNLTEEIQAVIWINDNPQAFCNTDDQKILSQVLVDFDQNTKDFYRWQIELSQEKIQELLNENLNVDFGEIVDLIPLKRGTSGRIIELKIIGLKNEIVIGKELIIRKALSDTHLYSSAFTIKKINIINNIPQKFVLKGAGWGHGVGLCQIGAAVMGEKGYSYEEILLHYFKNSIINKMY